MTDWEILVQCQHSRRQFLTRMTAAGLGASALSLLAGCGSGTYVAPGSGTNNNIIPGIPGRTADEIVLNYALTLEILEADLYRQALNLASGRPLTAPLDATLPSPNTTGAYTLSIAAGGIESTRVNAAFLYLAQYAYVEAAHRDFLRTVLNSFGAPTVTANARGYTAPLGTTLQSILETLLVVEETGVRAYLGAAGKMENVQLLTTAVAIHSTEARHSGAIAYILGKDPGPLFSGADRNVVDGRNTPNPAPYDQNTFQYYLEPATVLSAVQPFIVA
jgi:hypothetical protein